MKMSTSGRKRSSKWDSKDGDTQNLSGNDYIGKSGSYIRDKDPEHARFSPEGNGRYGNRRCVPDDDDARLKSRQHSGEAWPPRNRVSHEDGDDMMGYYDPRISSEQDESRQQYSRQSLPKDWTRTNKSGSRSNSRSRSRSPLQRVRRDGGGSYDRHKIRPHVSPRSGREIDGKYNRSGDYDWEAKHRKTSDSNSKYYTEDSREQQPLRVGGRTDYNSGFPEDNSNSRRETSDSFLRNHRNESARDRETQRRDIPQGEFHRRSNIPCRYFASGNCRNGNSCRFSHHGAPPPARVSPERKPHDEMFSRHDSNNHCGTAERMQNSHRWNEIERSDTGKSSEVEVSRVSNKAISEAKGINGSWLDDMEMSPDWNYRVKTLKKPMSEEQGVISQSSQSLVLENTLPPAYEQDRNRKSIGMLLTVAEKTAASSHHSFSNNLTNLAPPVQVFNQNTENHSAVPYQSTPLAVGESQVLLPAAENLPGGLKMSKPENGNAQNTVSREELNHISNISASLAQFFVNGQPNPHLQSTLNLKQALQVPEVYGNKEQSSHTQNTLLSNSSIHAGGVPPATELQINNSDTQQVQIPDSLVSLAGNPKPSSEENGDKKTEEEASKAPHGRKTGEEEEEEEEDAAGDAENVVEEEEDDKNNKKEKDPKGMRAFKFALVEIVKELLKPAWKEGGMNKDAYKNIVKKVVDKVTGTIQTGSIPQTQEKIDHYLSASKPKLTKLVQAYISKVKKS